MGRNSKVWRRGLVQGKEVPRPRRQRLRPRRQGRSRDRAPPPRCATALRRRTSCWCFGQGRPDWRIDRRSAGAARHLGSRRGTASPADLEGQDTAAHTPRRRSFIPNGANASRRAMPPSIRRAGVRDPECPASSRCRIRWRSAPTPTGSRSSTAGIDGSASSIWEPVRPTRLCHSRWVFPSGAGRAALSSYAPPD